MRVEGSYLESCRRAERRLIEALPQSAFPEPADAIPLSERGAAACASISWSWQSITNATETTSPLQAR